MAKNEKNEEVKVLTVDQALETVEIKDVATGENGELVKLVDVEHTRGIIVQLSKKYKKLVVTKDNYKKEGAEAEKILRQTRYSLQKVSKSNISILNKAKKEDKELFESLIDIIQPIEEKLKIGIEEFKDIAQREKELQEKLEEEKIKNITNKLKDLDVWFEKKIVTAKTQEDIIEYNLELDNLEKEFESFGDFEFDAKKIHAAFIGRRKEIELRVKEVSELEEERLQREKNKGVILEMRIKTLLEMDYKNDPQSEKLTGVKNFTHSEILGFNEIEWYKTLDEVKIKGIWDGLLVVFKGFGGNTSIYSNIEIPTKEDIESIKSKTIELQTKKNLAKKKDVNEEITPFRNEMLEFISKYNKKFSETEFKNKESKDILNNFINEIENAVNKVLGESIND